MQRRLLLLLSAPAALGAVALLAGCAGLGGPRVITLGEAELARLVGASFPVERRLLEVLDVQLAAPTIALLPERNRLSVLLRLKSTERLFGRSLEGRLRFDSALRYEPADASVRLTQVRVVQLDLGATSTDLPPDGVRAGDGGAGAQASAAGWLQRLGPALAERVLDELSIYRLGAARLAQLREHGLQPGAVTVTARGVEITLQRSGG